MSKSTILKQEWTGDLYGYVIIEEFSPSSGKPKWSVGVITGGCMEWRETIGVAELDYGEDHYCKSDLASYRERAINYLESTISEVLA